MVYGLIYAYQPFVIIVLAFIVELGSGGLGQSRVDTCSSSFVQLSVGEISPGGTNRSETWQETLPLGTDGDSEGVG